MTEYDKAVELAARAICRVDRRDPDEVVSHVTRAKSKHGLEFGEIIAWKKYVKQARATLEAFDAAGYVLVLKEATEAMVECYPYSYDAGLIEAMQPWERKKLIEAANAKGAIRRDER